LLEEEGREGGAIHQLLGCGDVIGAGKGEDFFDGV